MGTNPRPKFRLRSRVLLDSVQWLRSAILWNEEPSALVTLWVSHQNWPNMDLNSVDLNHTWVGPCCLEQIPVQQLRFWRWGWGGVITCTCSILHDSTLNRWAYCNSTIASYLQSVVMLMLLRFVAFMILHAISHIWYYMIC